MGHRRRKVGVSVGVRPKTLGGRHDRHPAAQPEVLDFRQRAAGEEVQERMDKLLHPESQREHRLRMGF